MDEAKIVQAYNEGLPSVIKLVKGLTDEINDLKVQIYLLVNRISELEERLNKNSKNSNKPPSSDGLKKPRNSREKSGKPTGGQPGHEGKTLQKIESPDEIVDLRPRRCNCGRCLDGVNGNMKTRQVFDIPKIAIQVTEYRTYELECPDCHKVHTAEFPETISQPVQYGENMQAFMAYLTNYQLLPLERSTEIIRDICGQEISQGTLVNVNQRIHDKLEGFEEEIKEQIQAAEIVHFDETGIRCDNKTQWLHNASTDVLTHYAVHSKRGSNAGKEIGILPNFTGVAVHDHWMPYYTFADGSHAECNAHNLRNLKGVHENYKMEWAKQMASLLVEIKRRVDALKFEDKETMPKEEIKKYEALYNGIIAKGRNEISEKMPNCPKTKTGKPKNSIAVTLLERLDKYNIETLSFMYDFKIPFDNNLAERDIRMVKLKQKISGCFRASSGADMFCRIRSYISTARKNGQDVLESLSKAIRGEAFIPQTL